VARGPLERRGVEALSKVTVAHYSPHVRLKRELETDRFRLESQPFSGAFTGRSARGVTSRCDRKALSVERKLSECMVSRLLWVAPSIHAGSRGCRPGEGEGEGEG